MTQVALITDSSAQLPGPLAAEVGAAVVPVMVSFNGHEYREGVDLDVDTFYAELVDTGPPKLVTAQPPAGAFLDAFEAAAAAGATEVVAVVVGSAFSGTVNSATVAAGHATVPVTVVDTGQASFGVGFCVLAAAETIAAGATGPEVEAAVASFAPTVESVFIVQALDLARASGRFVGGVLDGELTPDAVPVLRYAAGDLTVVAEVATPADAVEAMAAAVLGPGRRVRVASGLADPGTAPITDALEAQLDTSPLVTDLIRYRVGPSVAAHTGSGTAGVFFHPAPGSADVAG
ncbi:MAG: DegV family protein [Actinomycetota bacterium]